MISFTVRMRFAQEDRAEIAEILHELTAASRQEPGCVSYIPHWVQGEPCTALIYEQYQDQKAEEATASHRTSRSMPWQACTRRCWSAAAKTWPRWLEVESSRHSFIEHHERLRIPTDALSDCADMTLRHLQSQDFVKKHSFGHVI